MIRRFWNHDRRRTLEQAANHVYMAKKYLSDLDGCAKGTDREGKGSGFTAEYWQLEEIYKAMVGTYRASAPRR